MAKAAGKKPRAFGTSGARKKLEAMGRNPKNDWTFNDIETVAAGLDLELRKPNGSHSVISSPHLPGHANVPYARPIKAHYVKKFVALCFAHISAEEDHLSKGGVDD